MIVLTTGPNGMFGNVPGSPMSQNFASTLSEESKLSRTSFCSPRVESWMTAMRNFFGAARSGQVNGLATLDASSGSRPAMAASTSPQSSAVRHIGPSLSSVQLSAMAPCRLTRPYVGLSRLTPENAAGVMIEPDVSEPMANGTSAGGTAAPGPDDEPPAQ